MIEKVNKDRSPFTPGNPVPVELFVGRKKQLEEINRFIKQSSSGKQENVFLAGDRGIGKSSMAAFLRYIASTKENMLAVHTFLGGVATLPEMVKGIFDEILKESKDETWFNKIKGLFGSYIQKIGLFGVSIDFAPPKKELDSLVGNFPQAIENLVKKMKADKKGLFIALDDINGLASKEEFANWYKSFADYVATHLPDFPVIIVLIGLPHNRDTLAKLQPSLMRIFRVVDIERLSDSEVKTFVKQAFEKTSIKVNQDAIDVIVRYSSGLPLLMHEIGDALYWSDNDRIIDEKDAYGGIVEAAEKVGKKYIDPKVARAIKSKRYKSILKKLAPGKILMSFTKKSIEAELNANEKKVFHNFLRRFRDLGIIEQDAEEGPGAYKFVNQIYAVYIFLQSNF
ncbi:MAG: hypothetical protein DRP51_03350 [Candidatus Zixiibacteriota bacterium]|nr:MAG: hypothetical protein DRP51_03350 [candidate division Zixibacteria bacterium]HHI02132.1 ATP-binding protein [candidate division Zixibacteria bacterium]